MPVNDASPAETYGPSETYGDGRRLFAVVHADMVGYSRLIGSDDAGTCTRLQTLRRELIDPALAWNSGYLVGTAGDSLLARFDSVVSAVRFAITLQRGMPEFDADYPLDKRLRFRVGVSVGDAIPDGMNLHGNAVNIAARLQSLCPPGAICVCRIVREQVERQLGLGFKQLGSLALKNIPQPVESFILDPFSAHVSHDFPLKRRWRVMTMAGAASVFTIGASMIGPNSVGHRVLNQLLSQIPASHAASTQILTPRPERLASIAVLPFRNISDDPSQQYFADAVTGNVTTDLGRMRDIAVIAPQTIFSYDSKSASPSQVAHDLNVRYMTVGSIRRSGQRVATNIQLIDTTSGTQIWADRFESDFIDLDQLEDEVTGRIASSLNTELVHAEVRRIEPASTPDALDLRLRANSIFLRSVTPLSTKEARRLLTQSIQLDPGSAEAWGRLAHLTLSDYLNNWNETGLKDVDDAEYFIRQAFALDPNLSIAHFANGYLQRIRGEHQLALAAFDRAIALNPNYALAYVQRADELSLLGDPSQAPAAIERAIRLSPRDPSMGQFFWVAGRASFFSGDYTQAASWFRKAVELRPNLYYNWLYLSSCYALTGDLTGARKTLESFTNQFRPQVYTLDKVIKLEQRNPNTEPRVVAARNIYHRGLVLAGMAER